MELQKEWQTCKEQVATFLNSYFQQKTNLVEAMLYTLGQGKKFRPFLSYATAIALNKSTRPVIAFASAIEMVHAFSLIHDDLPALDNDDYRRGEKTNHKVFGEATAILAGDALLNEAFRCISTNYQENPRLSLQLINMIADAVGTKGMIEGQVQDLKAQGIAFDYESLKKVHELKTGALISASVLGAALISEANGTDYSNLKIYSENLGLAFQIADDLLEAKEGKTELGSYVGILGFEKAKQELDLTSEKALASIQGLANAELLKLLVKENQNRNF
jgi:geranylgeranyl diphosphate synthase, type II